MRWRDSVAMPALIGLRAWNPAGREQIECLPQIPNTWTRNIVTKALGRFGPKRHLIRFDGLEQREPLAPRDALRGVDSYVTSGGGTSVELPGGYEHAWTNGLGEYVLTDSGFLNPNEFASGSWERMQRGR